MSSLLRTKGVQIGQDNTATNNFTLYQPGVPDGTLRIGNGNADSVTDAITLDSSGNITAAQNLTVSGDLTVSGNQEIVTTGTYNKLEIKSTSVSDLSLTDTNGDKSWVWSNRGNGNLALIYEYPTNTFQTRMNIDSSGRVTMPYQPSFKAFQTASGQINVNNVQLVFNDVTTRGGHNIGGHYNTSTGVFTAPISGRYLMSAAMLTNAGNMGNSSVNIQWRINGTNVHYMAHNHSSFWVMETGSVIFNLSANDTVDLYLYYGSGHYGSYSYFSGRLIG